jgi:hypothetical protein
MDTNQKNLTVLPVIMPDDDMDEKWNALDPRLPKPPFLMVFNAPVASGKTTLLMNLIYNDNYYKDLFDSIVIISPTIENDSTWRTALDDDRIMIVSGDRLDQADDIIEEIYKNQMEKVIISKKEKKTKPHILIILDDMLGLIGKQFDLLCTRHRHPAISILIATQDFRSLKNKCRQNASQYVIFRTNNKKELAKMEEEFSSNFPDFLTLYNEATQEKHSFLTIHQRTVKAYKRFEELLWEKT